MMGRFKLFVWNLANAVLAKGGYQLVSTDPSQATTMRGLLSRASKRFPGIDLVVDLGAASGDWSRMALEYFPKAKVLGVEPLREREADLQRLGSQHPRFRYQACAAGPVDGTLVSLLVTDDLDGSTVQASGNGQVRKVVSRTVDALVGEHNACLQVFLKFDTHGFELPILEGCAGVLAKTVAILVEVYNFNVTADSLRFPAFCSHMERLGFRCLDLADPMLRTHDQAFWQMDLLFVRADARFFENNRYA